LRRNSCPGYSKWLPLLAVIFFFAWEDIRVKLIVGVCLETSEIYELPKESRIYNPENNSSWTEKDCIEAYINDTGSPASKFWDDCWRITFIDEVEEETSHGVSV
jgi:hypothetical protein